MERRGELGVPPLAGELLVIDTVGRRARSFIRILLVISLPHSSGRLHIQEYLGSTHGTGRVGEKDTKLGS